MRPSPARADRVVVPEIPAALPAPFAVMPFENRSGVQGLDWMRAAVPFILAEKAELHGGLRPVYGTLILPTVPPVPEDATAVAQFASQIGAELVWTGWFKRPNWDLQLAISLWKVEAGQASRVGQVVARGKFPELNKMAADAIIELTEKAGHPASAEARKALNTPSFDDFYAFTLFGRGLTTYLGIDGKPDLERAKKDLERSVFINPQLGVAQRVLADLYRQSGLVNKARGRLEFALEMHPDYAAALAALAGVEHERGKLEAARELYAKLLVQRPWDLEARFRLGQMLWESGASDEAFTELSRVVEHRPDDVRVRRILVLIHASRGDNEQLVKELEKVAELDPKDQTTRLDLAAGYAAVGREKDAIATYRGVIEGDPSNVQALKFLGDLYKRQGKLPRAIKYYGLALKVKPEDPRAYFLLGAAYVEAGDDAQAKRIYRQAQRFKRFLPEVYNNLGAIAYREGNLEESVWYLKRAVSKRPRKARYRYNYALSLSAALEPDQALTQIDAGLEMEPEHVELRYLRGVVLLRRGQAALARKDFEETLRLDPEHEGAKHNLTLLDELDRRAREGEVVVEGKSD
jgi:tetratricopeptide (TPR) repeat protein